MRMTSTDEHKRSANKHVAAVGRRGVVQQSRALGEQCLHKETYCSVMRLSIGDGHHSAALRQFEIYRRILLEKGYFDARPQSCYVIFVTLVGEHA